MKRLVQAYPLMFPHEGNTGSRFSCEEQLQGQWARKPLFSQFLVYGQSVARAESHDIVYGCTQKQAIDEPNSVAPRYVAHRKYTGPSDLDDLTQSDVRRRQDRSQLQRRISDKVTSK